MPRSSPPPERTRAIALFQPVTRFEWPHADRDITQLHNEWGTQAYADELLTYNAPDLLESEDVRRWFANWLRVGASPASAYFQNRVIAEADLTDVLPAVRVPALVL